MSRARTLPEAAFLLLSLVSGATRADAAADPVAEGDAKAVDVRSILPHAGPATDYAATINTLLKAGQHVLLPNDGMPYFVSDTIQFGANSALLGQNGTRITFRHANTVWRVRSDASNAAMRDILWDGSASHGIKGQSYCAATGFSWIGGGMRYGGTVFVTPGCDGAVLSHLAISDNYGSAIALIGGNGATVSASDFRNNAGFGVFVTDNSSRFVITGNHAEDNAAEGVAVGVKGHDGRITDNIVVHSADNCFSLSGHGVVLSGNRGSFCLGSGLGLFGDSNVVTNNVFLDNGQFDNPKSPPIALYDGTVKPVFHSPHYVGPYYGITAVGAFGGYAQNDVIVGNRIDDDQASPTQEGIELGTGIAPWKAGPYTVGSYVFSNGSTFESRTAGQSTQAPAGRGTVHDPGGVVWDYISTPAGGSLSPASTRIRCNVLVHWRARKLAMVPGTILDAVPSNPATGCDRAG